MDAVILHVVVLQVALDECVWLAERNVSESITFQEGQGSGNTAQCSFGDVNESFTQHDGDQRRIFRSLLFLGLCGLFSAHAGFVVQPSNSHQLSAFLG